MFYTYMQKNSEAKGSVENMLTYLYKGLHKLSLAQAMITFVYWIWHKHVYFCFGFHRSIFLSDMSDLEASNYRVI